MTSSSVLSLEEAEESLIESPVHPPVPGLRRWSLVFSVSLLPPAVATIGLCVLVVTFVITSQRECLPPGRTLPLISDTAAPHPQYWIFLAGMVTISALLLPTLLCKFAVRVFVHRRCHRCAHTSCDALQPFRDYVASDCDASAHHHHHLTAADGKGAAMAAA